MNKRHFSIRNLLDGFTRANKLANGIQHLGTIISPRVADIWLGPSIEIRASLQQAVIEAAPYSEAILVHVSANTESLIFDLQSLVVDEKNVQKLLLSKRFTTSRFLAELDGYQSVGLSFTVPAVPVGTVGVDTRMKRIHVVRESPIDTYVIERQVKELGHHILSMTPTERLNITQPADVVFVDQAVNSQTLGVAGGHKFVGLGENSDLLEKILNPGSIVELVAAMPSEQRESIVIVDDSLPSLHTTAAILETVGLDALTYEAGHDALDAIQKTPVDILLTDINLEDMSGLDLIREAKTRGSANRIIAMTGETDIGVHQEIFLMGADQLIVKPARKDSLIRALRNPELRQISNEEYA